MLLGRGLVVVPLLQAEREFQALAPRSSLATALRSGWAPRPVGSGLGELPHHFTTSPLLRFATALTGNEATQGLALLFGLR